MATPIIESEEIPQADSLDNVIITAEAVSKGKTSFQTIARALGLDTRQGRYYRKAAEILGLIKNYRNFSVLTPLGHKMVTADRAEQQRVLKNQILSLPIVQIILGMISNSDSATPKDDLADSLSKLTTTTRGMIDRRLSTILSWLGTLGIVRKDGKYYRLRSAAPIEKMEISKSTLPVLPRLDNLKLFHEVNLRVTNASPTIKHEIESVKLERTNEIHEKLRNSLARRIVEIGALPSYNSFIDLATRIKKEDYIIEVKTLNGDVKTQIRKGMSQLYEYRYLQSLPNAKLVLLIEHPLEGENYWMSDYLIRDRRIFVVWHADDQLFTTEEAGKRLPFI